MSIDVRRRTCKRKFLLSEVIRAVFDLMELDLKQL